MSNPPYNLFGQSSPIQDEEVLPKEPPQKDLWRGLPTFQSGPCLYSSGTTSLKSVGLAPSVTHGSENKTDGLAETRTTSNLNCTSVGFYSSSSEFFSASDGQRLSDMDFDKRLFDLSSSHRKDVHANTSKFIKDLEVGDTNITDQPDLSNLAITRQAAAKILMDYGLEKEDLDELISCPTEQTTAQNLPRTLWKIRMKKALRAATTNKSTLGSEPLSSTRDSGLNPVNAPEGVGTGQAVVPPTTGQHSKVVDFQHLEIHTAAVDKTLDTTDSANKSNQSPQEGIMALKRSILNLFSSQQTVCITSVNLTGNSETPPGSSSVKLLQNDPNRSLLKSEVSKSSMLGKVVPTVEAVPACGFLTGIIPKPDLVSVKGNDISSGQMDIQGEAPKFTEKTMDQTPPVQQLFKSHMGQTEGSKVVPAGKPMPLLSLTIPARNNAPLPLLTLDLLPQQVLDPAKTKKKPSQEGKPTAKGLPSLTVMHDYAGFTPRKFSHTCSLCKKTCSQMKEWKSHKYTSLHLQNCKDLRKQYPKWDGKVPQLQRKSLVPVQASKPHPQKRRAKSRSRSSSQSPVRYRVSEDGRESRCGRTRSQRSPRRISRSRSSSWSPQYDWTSTSHNRSRSRSLERGRSPKRRDRRRSSPRRSIERQFSPRRFSPRRFMERQFSPGRIIERRFSPGRIVEPQFSPGRIIERRFSPGRIMERRFSPKRVIERRFSPRRSREQRSSSRSRERQSSPRRIIERRFSPRRSRERRSSPRIFIERRFSSSRSRERRSSSSSSRERRSSPRRSIEQRSSPRRIIERRYSSSSSRERRSSPRRSIERRSSPRRSIERQSSPRRIIERRYSSSSSRERRSSPRRSIERRSSPRRIIERRYSSSSSIDRWSSPRRSIERRSSPRTKGDKRLSPRLSHEQSLSPKRIEERSLVKSIPKFRSSPLKKNEKRSSLTKSCKRKASHLKSLPPQKKPCSLENLTERLLKTPVVQSLSGQQSVEDMVKTMVPFVLEELARMSTSSSSPAPLSKLLKDSSSSSPLSGESSFLSAGSTSSSAVKVGRIANLNNENTSPIKSKFSKPSPPTMVKLKGTFDTLCHSDLISAMDIYGKTKSVLLFKPKQEDVVFERPTQTSTPEQKNPQQNSSDLSPTTSQTSSTGSTTVLSFKKLLSLPEKPQTSTTGKHLTEAKSSAFKGKIGAAKKTVKSIKPKSITAKAPIESAVVEKELSMRQETEERQKSPEETPQTEKPADFIVAKPSKEFLAFNAEMAPTATHEKLEEPAKSVGKLLIKAPENKWLHPAHGDEKDGGNAKKLLESIVSERQLVPSEVQVEAMDTKDQESILEAGDSAEAMPPTEIKDHSELPEVFVEAKDVADSGHEEKAQESEILKDKSSENKTDPKTLPAKPNKSPPPTSTEIKLETPSTDRLKKPEVNQQKPPETSVKAASTTPASGSSGNLSVGASAETSSDAKTSVGVETKTCHTVPTSVSASANAKKTPKPPPESKHPVPLSCQQATNISTYISPQTLNRVKPSQNLFSDDLSFSSLLMLISNLPIQTFTSYTEEDVVHVLSKFGFKYEDDNIYIFPGKCMALVLMPDIWTVNDILKVSNSNYFTLKTRKLAASVVTKNISMSPLGFYKCMLKLTPLPVKDDENVVYIQDISCSEIKDLLTVMKKTDSVTSYLPLMNKVFIEFETMYDADRLGVWYSLLKRRRSHKVRRLKTPRFTSTSQPPKLPMQALPNTKDIIDGSIIVPESVTVPAGSTPPFWVTMTTSPYVFATVSPWFSIPDFLTVQNLDDLNKASSKGSAFSTVMLTGLPEGNYTQQDVTKLLEPHFSKKPLNHNLMILPLQRRAFVRFYSWDVCCSFIQDHIKNPVSVHGCKLQLHLVLEDLQLGSSQDLMYKSLMKLSHIYVPELDHVGDQLLCVEVSEVKLDLIKDVVNEVASAASFVNFLPLANKIWVEMVSASDAEKVVKKLLSVKDVSKDSLWSIVGRIETLKSLKRRLKDAIEDPVDLPAASKPTDSGGPESAEEKASTLSSDHTPPGAPQKEQSGNKQSVNTPGPVQSDSPPEPQTPIEGLKTAGGDLKEQEAAGVPADDLEAKQTPAGGGSTPEKDPAAAATRNQPDPTSGGISIKPSPEVKRPPFLNPFTVTVIPSPTVGEKIGTLLHLEQISCLSEDSIKTPEKVTIQRRVILITNLPEFHDDCYSEADISNLLRNFGFQYEDTHLYVIPQSCMAFALMPSFRSVKKLMKESESKPFTLLGSRLHLHVVTSNILMSPFGFYKSLMALVKVKVIDDGASTIYINNISPSESRFLRAALQKIDSVKNYLPLLNKVFVEFESIRDADRLGVWYSLLKNCPAFSIFRLRIPRNDKTSLPPRLATKALPDCKDVVPGAVVPATNCGVPLGSTAPFSVTMTTAPYVFPTMSPWFKIPDFVTVFEIKDIQKVKFRAWKFSTIMLTNLPEGNYSHREVVKLVWDYFPNQNLQTINYKVVVLPLQRRAFVLFENWSSCCKFVQSHGTAPVRVQGSKLNLHMVLEELQIGSSEETLFRSLMKWSNSRVPELESLEERLLCVHISKVSVQLIILIMKTVGAIAPFVSFLPLANRICIEMVEASGVTQVVKKLSDKSEVGEWSKVQSVESLQSLKQRLKKQENLKITLDDTSKSATALKQKVPKLAVQTKPSETAANVNPGVKNSESGELGGGQTEPMEVEASASNSKDVLPEEACSAPPPERLTAPPPRATADVKTQETEDLKEPQSTMKASQRKQEPEPQTGVEVKEEEDEIKQPDPNPGAAASTSSHVTRLTPGEQTVHELTPVMLGCCKPKNILRMIGRAHPDPIREHKGYRGHYVKVYGPNVLCLANLPMYEDCSYSEVDIVNMLHGFGVECGTDDVFVFIESRLALVYLDSVEKVENFFWVLKNKHLILKGHRLHACALRKMVKNSVLGIYIYIMSRTRFGSSFSKWCMVYIQNIPHSDRSNLIQTVKKVCSVKNVLPMLNKVLIECTSLIDVDLLGVWLASQKKHQPYSVVRMDEGSPRLSTGPGSVMKAVPGSTGDFTVIHTTEVIPVDSLPPFWINMVIEPYVFNTHSPWFKIPDFWTLNQKIHAKTYSKASQFSTVMLTGALCFDQKEILQRVLSFFAEQNLFTLSYRVVVLPLQSRAFIFFSSWKECLKFVNDEFKSPSQARKYSVHLVLEDMNPGYCEEDQYRSLMKWSNAHVTETASLEERLLCVGVTATNVDLTKAVLMGVARVAPFVNVLPLGNMIYIEMVDSNAAEKVLKNTPTFSDTDMERILLIESVKGRKERLKGCERIPVNIDDPFQLTAQLPRQPPALVKVHQDSSSSVSVVTPASAGDSELLASSSSLGESSNVETEEGSRVQTVKNVGDVPPMDEKSFNAIKAAVQFYKQTQKSKNNQTSNKTPEDSSKDSLSDESCSVDKVQDTTAAESSSQTVDTSMVANEVTVKPLEDSTTSGSSCSSPSQLTEAHRNPSEMVQTSPASAEQKSPPPTDHSSLSEEDLLKLDESADDKSSEMESQTQMKKNPEKEEKDEDEKDNDHKTLNSSDPQNNKEVQTCELKEQRSQEDDPQEPSSETQMEAERSTRRRSSRRIQEEKKTQEDKVMVREPSSISTRSSTRRMTEKTSNVGKGTMTPIKKTPASRKRPSSGAEDVKKEENPTPSRPRGRPRKRTRPAADEAEEPKQNPPPPRSPSPASDYELPPYDPKTPLGQQFVESKWGFFCKLCSLPFLTKEQHCSSKEHYDNLQGDKSPDDEIQLKDGKTILDTMPCIPRSSVEQKLKKKEKKDKMQRKSPSGQARIQSEATEALGRHTAVAILTDKPPETDLCLGDLLTLDPPAEDHEMTEERPEDFRCVNKELPQDGKTASPIPMATGRYFRPARAQIPRGRKVQFYSLIYLVSGRTDIIKLNKRFLRQPHVWSNIVMVKNGEPCGRCQHLTREEEEDLKSSSVILHRYSENPRVSADWCGASKNLVSITVWGHPEDQYLPRFQWMECRTREETPRRYFVFEDLEPSAPFYTQQGGC
ncbi:uncharacterized protein LOC112155986 isoform X3 [Oryzias melastigma]|uniref:uncharacterized protein LOC112155986 isoform X3 n=1 Tax=Oryzias melastigma TaxID=30732 RepID=UPI000CF7BB3D|nr:uncharacterized protein LOC112155986 isoform X3 [Oryzias melastigma]